MHLYNVEDDSETFLVTLQATDDDERISEQNSQVTITIDTTTPTPTPIYTPTPPGDDVEGISSMVVLSI